MNQISFAPDGLKYWKKIYDSLISSDWKCIKELWDEKIESLLFSSSISLKCVPCSGLHVQEDIDHCLHCEELLQLSFFSILLSQASQDKQCLYLFKNLFTKHQLCQKLIDRIYASSIYISHLAGKVLVSLISLNPFKYFTENGFGDMVLLFIDHPQSHINACRGFLMLKNILRAKLPKEVNASYVSALCSSWTTIVSAYKEHITELECNIAFLTFWWKLFKNINKNSNDPEFSFYKSQITSYFHLNLDYLCQNFQSSWTHNEHLFKISLKLFCTVLNYETDLSVQKNIPVVYHNICLQLLQNETFSQTAFNASVLRSSHPIRIGGSNIQIHSNPHEYCDKKWTKFKSDCDCPPLNMSLLRKLILLEFNVCAIALRSDHFKHASESEDINVQVLEKILLKLQQMCSFIHYNLQAKFQLQEEQIIDWLPQVFADQDNCWIQVLLAVTDLYVISKMRNQENIAAKRISALINPHLMFQQFLKSLVFDSSVLLDLLTSPETCFLLYFLKYIKLLSKEWHLFKALHQETYIDSRNKSTSKFYNIRASDLASNSQLPNSRTKKMIQISNEKNVIVDCVAKSEDHYSIPSSHSVENLKCSFKRNIVEDSETTDKVHNSQNVSINISQDHNTIKQSKDNYLESKMKQKLPTETLNFVSDSLMINCNYEKASTYIPHQDSIQMQPEQLTSLKGFFTNSQDDNVSPLSKIELKQTDDKEINVATTNSCVKGIGLASIQAYSNNSSNSEEEDEDFDNIIKKKHSAHDLSSSVFNDVPQTKEQFYNSKCRENEKSQTQRETFWTPKRSQEQFGNTFINSHSHISNVTSSNSTLDHAIYCLNRLLQLLKRLSKSSVLPYNPQPLINALEVCMALYET